jgi:O-antigen ligase
MRTAISASRLGADEALLIGATGILMILALTVEGESALAYLVMAIPIVVGLSWWRPVYGFALLLGLAMLTEQFEINTMPESIKPMALQTLPIFENLKDYTPVPLQANAVEIWLVFLAVVWLVQGVLSNRLRLSAIPCPPAWLIAAGTILVAFTYGVVQGGDVKVALWEIRALGYLLGLIWLVPQVVEKRRDVTLLLSVIVVTLGIKSVQGLYRYFVILGMELDLRETFMAHEDPVMIIPMLFLLAALYYYRTTPFLTRVLLGSAPFMFTALVLTQRRVAYIGLAISMVVFFTTLSTLPRRRILRVALPILLVFAAYAAAFAGSDSPLGRPIQRALTIFDSTNTSNLYRVLELENLRYTIRNHPWGIGFGHPYEIIRQMPKLEFSLVDYIPHNQVMWLWVKTGTVGFVLMLFFFARMVSEAVWTYRRSRDPLLCAVAVIIPIAIINQLVASSFELQLTFGRNMIYLGTLIGLLGPIQRWAGLEPKKSGLRWTL